MCNHSCPPHSQPLCLPPSSSKTVQLISVSLYLFCLPHLRYFTSPSFSSSSLFLLHKDWSLVPNHSTSRRCLEFISLYCIIIFCLDNCKHIICLSFPISTSLQTIFLIAFHSLNPVMTLSSVKPFGGFPLWTKQCLTPWHTQNALHSLASFYPSRLVCCYLPP